MVFLRKLLILLSLLAVATGGVRAASQPRTLLPDSIKALDPHRVRAVRALRKEHLGKEMEFQIALRMRDFPKLLKRMATGEVISHEEMEARYLPLPADYDAVIRWAKQEGFTVTQTDPLRLGVFVRGTIAQIQNATQAQFQEVTVADGTYTSAVTAPSVPASLGAAVLGLNGLQPHIHLEHMQSVQPQVANEPPYLVKEIMNAYGATGLGYDGTGETIAILIDTFPQSSDLTAFWTYNDIPQSLSNIQEIQAVAGTLDPVSGEETLDTEWTSGIASGANIRVYATADLSFTDLDKGLQRILSDLPNEPSMHELSISLGLGENDVSSSQKETDSQYFANITNYGVSIFVASGDDGAVMDGVLQPSYYASDPNVTGVGGTSLYLYSTGAIEAETGWNGSGGGESTFFARPDWQVGNGVPSGTTRCVPDVASVADPNTGAYIYLKGTAQQVGGTSWAAPTWAGFCALINEARTQNGLPPLGLLNPRIYPLLGTSSFRDIVTGSNGGFQATPGYDLVTGLGTPVMSALLPALSNGASTTPEVTTFKPVAGPAGTSVAITGVNLERVTNVEFSGSTAQFTIDSANSISATVPQGAVTGPITLISGTTASVSSIDFQVVPLPTNDDFANAAGISGTSGQVMGSNLGATRETGEPEIAGNPGGASVWWAWQAPGNGTYTFSTAGSSFDTIEAVCTGTAVNVLTVIASNDDYGTSVTSSVTFTATAGTIYYINVDGYDGAEGAITLTWEENAAVPVISGFTPQMGSEGTVVTISGANFLGTSGVTLGGTVAGFNVVSDTETTITVPQGAQTGPIAITGPLGTAVSSGNFVVVQPVSNDDFINAAVIDGPSGTITGNNQGATKEPGEPDIAGNPGGASIWYSWTPASTGPETFTTFGSTFNTLLGVFTGPNVASLTPVAEDAAYGNTVTSSVTFLAYAGTTYHIAVDGFDGATGNVVLNWAKDDALPVIDGFSPTSGPPDTTLEITGSNFTGATSVSLGTTPLDYTVLSDSEITATVPSGASSGLISVGNLLGAVNSASTFTVTAGPSNDDFANSIPLTGADVHVTGANVGATKELGEPDIAGNPGGASVWWSWTAPADGVYAISTLGSNFDTLLGVYTGDAVDALTLVAQNDDDPAGGVTSYLTIDATAGTVYRIAVDGLNGAEGSIVLSIYPQEASTDLYSTGFEAKDGFVSGQPLTGQPLDLSGGAKWTTVGTGGNGIVTGFDAMPGQQAYVGYNPPTTPGDGGVFAYYPIDFSPISAGQPVVTFTVLMAINDSTNFNYDDFQWRLYNKEGHNFFTLDFANEDLQVYYLQDGARDYVPTGVQFANNTAMSLKITMDFAHNKWSATLNGSTLVTDKAIRTGSAPLDVGDMDAVWQIYNADAPGNNYMVFDNYSLEAQQNPTPHITFQPQSQSVVQGNPVNLSVVATGQEPLYYQWMFNNKALPGENTAVLDISDAGPFNAGSYTVQVSNAVGLVTSAPAKVTVSPQPAIPSATIQPGSQTVAAGSAALFSATPTGYPAPTLQWMFQGNPIKGATRATLRVPNAQAGNAGAYTVVASNALGSGTSSPATLAIGKSFASQAGNFDGLIYNGAVGGGLLKVTLGAGGAFSGSIILGSRSYRLAGAFNAEGEWQGTVGKAGASQVTVNLQLALSGANEITGSIVAGGNTQTSTALRDNFNKSGNPAPEMPAYTLALTGTGQGLPQGIGYAAITVDQAGNVRATGRLGDDTPFTVSSTVSDGGTCPIYTALYNSTGYIGGLVTFEPLAQTDLDGAMNWLRPAENKPGGFSAGFEGNVSASGYIYTQPNHDAAAIPLDTQHQGSITFSGSVVNNPVIGQLSLSPTGALLASGTSDIKLSLAPKSGVFSGTLNLGYPKPVPFAGVLIQRQDGGEGLFETPTVSGEVQITSP